MIEEKLKEVEKSVDSFNQKVTYPIFRFLIFFSFWSVIAVIAFEVVSSIIGGGLSK